MSDIHYKIVEHDGGWAYKLGDVFSETFRTHDEAAEAAKRVVVEQTVPGETQPISYQDEKGRWHDEVASGSDRPTADVEG